jgi:prepilin-type N-terminal cleavage/methylation domain-containing protein
MSLRKIYLNKLSRVLPGREGFSLVEILMVLMILTVGIIPLAVIQHQARQDVQESDMYSSGLNLAQSQLERIKGLGFGNAVPDSGLVGNIQWRARITNVSFGLDQVEVTTTWPSGGGNQTITVADLMSMR